MKRTDLANDAENAQLRSVVGSLSWAARQARPDLSYCAGRPPSRTYTTATRWWRTHKNSQSMNCTHKAGAIKWEDGILCTVRDASWSKEQEGKVEPYRSQRARMTLLVDKTHARLSRRYVRLDGHRPRSSVYADPRCRQNPMISGVEEGFKIRAMIGDCCNKTLEEPSRKFLRHLWLTDCESLCKNTCVLPLWPRLLTRDCHWV